jgi:hypothetical protein
MNYTKFITLFCIIFSLYNTSKLTAMPEENNYIQQYLLQPVQKHPKKTITGASLLGFGIKCIYEGSKTRNIKSEHGVYKSLSNDQQAVGYTLMVLGTVLLLPALYEALFSENTTTTKTNKPAFPEKK